jgi:hypothetical protein
MNNKKKSLPTGHSDTQGEKKKKERKRKEATVSVLPVRRRVRILPS